MTQLDHATEGLAFDDGADEAAAVRGFLRGLDADTVTDAAGTVVWDAAAYGFLAGDRPDTVHPSLWRQSRLVARAGLFEVVPGIYQVRGLDLSNMTLVEGQAGVIVIDPLISAETAAAALALYRAERGDRRVTAVVHTHSHVDHFGGVRGVLDDPDGIPVVAPAGFLQHAVDENVYAGPAMARRAAYMYGAALPKGPAGQVGAGLGMTTSTGTVGLVPPTLEITATGQTERIDGVEMVFQLTPGTEAPAEMNFFFPASNALCAAENACHTLHNVLTLRGAVVRDARAWAAYLTETIQLFGDRADVVFASHHWPTWGRESLLAFLSGQRDVYAYLHDQTLRLINKGLTGPEIAETLTLPTELARQWHTRGYYGSVSHNVKAIYQRYMGWFDGNPAHLWQHPPVAAARRYVAFMGGADAVVAKARQSFVDGDLRWVVEVLDRVLFAQPDHAEARRLQADAMQRLGHGAENGTWRNFYLTGAAELRHGVVGTPTQPTSPDLLAALSIEQVFASLAVRLDGPRAAGTRLALRFDFTDLGAEYSVLLANGVLTAVRGALVGGGEPAATVRLTRAALNALLAGTDSVTDLSIDGRLRIDGDPEAVGTLLSLLDGPDPDFAIVTP
jgi:linear primary-alkylsulfatase